MLRRLARLLWGRRLTELETRVWHLERELDAARSRADVGQAMAERFQADRLTPGYQAAFDDPDPLVTACVGTYNRAALLTERCIPSLLRQTHGNLEILVVGDACTDDTEERLRALGDARIRFENLNQRGPYPEDPVRRWMVAGTRPVNRALELARGRFITHLDDDDEHAPDRIEKLLALIRSTRSDLVYHPFEYEDREGRWSLNDARAFEKKRVTTSSVLYHAWLKRIPWDLNAAEYFEAGDWNRMRKILWIGARIERHPDVLLRHHRENANAR